MHPDDARDMCRQKPRSLTSKVMSVRDAVASLVHDGDYLAPGGFGANRIAQLTDTFLIDTLIKKLVLGWHCCS